MTKNRAMNLLDTIINDTICDTYDDSGRWLDILQNYGFTNAELIKDFGCDKEMVEAAQRVI